MRAKDTWAMMAGGALLCAAGALADDDYPQRPVRLIVTGAAGTGIDLDSRAVAPRGTPQPIIERLHSVAAKAVSAPEVRERMIGFGAVPMGGTPAEFAQYIKVEQAKWSKVIRDANVRIE